jgi:hypothetical protein
MKSICQNCGNTMEGKRAGAKFCSLECKNEYGYRLRSGQIGPPPSVGSPLDLSLNGTIEAEPEKENQKNEPQKDLQKKESNRNVDADFFNSLVQDNIIYDSPQEKNIQPENQVGEITDGKEDSQKQLTGLSNLVPQKFIIQKVQKQNSAYLVYKFQLGTMQRKKELLEKEFKDLINQLQYQKERSGKGLIWAGSISGVLLSLNSSDTKTDSQNIRKKKKTEKKTNNESGFWSSLLKGLFYGAIGAGVGHLTKSATEDILNRDKAEKMAAITKRLFEIRAEYKELIPTINILAAKENAIPKLIETEEQQFNPEYQKAIESQPLPKLDVLLGLPAKTKPSQSQPIKFKSDKIIKVSEVGKMHHPALKFRGAWGQFFGSNPSVNFHFLIHGNSGEGKSTFCIWLAKYLAENFGRVLYVSGEEGVNMTFKEKIKYCNAVVENFFVLDVRTGDDFMREIVPGEFHFIVLDSLHDMEIDAEKMKQIFQKYKNSGFICIDQNNKKGELLGANEKKHICDVVVNVKDYTAETTKNRFKQKGYVIKK